jgi:hypothetical protein
MFGVDDTKLKRTPSSSAMMELRLPLNKPGLRATEMMVTRTKSGTRADGDIFMPFGNYSTAQRGGCNKRCGAMSSVCIDIIFMPYQFTRLRRSLDLTIDKSCVASGVQILRLLRRWDGIGME